MSTANRNVISDQAKAVRLARAIASDILLYNQEKIASGIQEDNFFDALSAELREGEELYQGRVSEALDADAALYWQAIVNVILVSQAHQKTKAW